MYYRPPVRVLIAEDHIFMSRLLVSFVDMVCGALCVGVALDGKQALQMCDQLMPDVVLMDLAMPKIDGITAMQLILNTHTNVRIVAMSVSDDPVMIEAARRSGACAVLQKPLSIEDLTRTITQIAA